MEVHKDFLFLISNNNDLKIFNLVEWHFINSPECVLTVEKVLSFEIR